MKFDKIISDNTKDLWRNLPEETKKTIKNFDEMYKQIFEACWKNYKKVGMKKKGKKMVPNCVPK
jgi:DNA-binding ferritin-like protein (Dps family)